MTGPERGFLLLCCHLGNPARKPLTTAQFRKLARRVRDSAPPAHDRELVPGDLIALGYGPEEADRITALLEEEALLDRYLAKAKRAGCVPLTWLSAEYPATLKARLGDDAPGCLWARGDLSLLEQPRIALVGSRELHPENASFAHQVGIQAAEQNFTLVSGNARGADRTAQNACLAAGGRVISVIADRLTDHVPLPGILYLSEDGFDLEFTPQRALSRNRIIHSLGQLTLVAQCSLKTGGTWDGSVKNLRFGWTPLLVFDDGSEAACLLEQMGATLLPADTPINFDIFPQPML